MAVKIKLSSVFGPEQVPAHEARGVIEERLRSAILDGRLAPGTAVRQQELATLFGVSRMPVLESEALRQSVPRLTPEDIDQARDYIRQLQEQTEHAELGRLNRLFHMTLYSKASNQRLLRLIEHELNQEERFLRFHLSSMGLGTLTQDDHLALLDAASQRQVETAVQVLEAHLNKGAQTIRAYLDRQPASHG